MQIVVLRKKSRSNPEEDGTMTPGGHEQIVKLHLTRLKADTAETWWGRRDYKDVWMVSKCKTICET